MCVCVCVCMRMGMCARLSLIFTNKPYILWCKCVVFACARVCLCSCVDDNSRKKTTLYRCFTAALLLFYCCIVADCICTGDLAKKLKI